MVTRVEIIEKARARHQAMREMYESGGITLKEVGRHFGISGHRARNCIEYAKRHERERRENIWPDVGVRAVNCLKNMGHASFAEAMDCGLDIDDFAKQPNVGKATVAEVKKAIEQFNHG